jgi:hypothetical protein
MWFGSTSSYPVLSYAAGHTLPLINKNCLKFWKDWFAVVEGFDGLHSAPLPYLLSGRVLYVTNASSGTLQHGVHSYLSMSASKGTGWNSSIFIDCI